MANKDEMKNVVEETVEVENCGVEAVEDGAELIVTESKFKTFSENVKAKAKKHKKKIIGGAVAVGAVALAAVKLLGHKDDDDFDSEDYIDVEAIEVDTVEETE